MPTSRATARSDSAAAPTSASWRRAASVISRGELGANAVAGGRRHAPMMRVGER